MSAQLANNQQDSTRTERLPFTKEVKPKLLGVTLAGPDTPQPGIHLEDW